MEDFKPVQRWNGIQSLHVSITQPSFNSREGGGHLLNCSDFVMLSFLCPLDEIADRRVDSRNREAFKAPPPANDWRGRKLFGLNLSTDSIAHRQSWCLELQI